MCFGGGRRVVQRQVELREVGHRTTISRPQRQSGVVVRARVGVVWRRLSGGVVVSYTIAYDDEVTPTLTLDAAMFDQALTDAAAASGVADVFDAVETVAFGGSEAPVAAASESEESEVVSDAAFRPLGRGVFLVAAAAACLL